MDIIKCLQIDEVKATIFSIKNNLIKLRNSAEEQLFHAQTWLMKANQSHVILCLIFLLINLLSQH